MICPCISPDLQMYREKKQKISVYNKSTGKIYVVGEKEYKVLQNLDGLTEISGLTQKCNDFLEADVIELIEQFRRLGFLKGYEIKKKRNILKIKKSLLNGNKLISPNCFIWKLFFCGVIFLSIPLLTAGLILTYRSGGTSVFENLQQYVVSVHIIILIPFTLISLVIHELSHAVVARCLGANVPEMGLMLYWFMPCAYTNLSCICFLEERWKRLLILFAGIFSNMGIIGGALILLQVVPLADRELLIWIALSNVSCVFANLQFFIQLDGYFILEELIGIQGLRTKSYTYIKQKVQSYIAQRKNGLQQKYVSYKMNLIDDTKLEHTVYLFYSALVCMYTPILIVSLFSSALGFIQ